MLYNTMRLQLLLFGPGMIEDKGSEFLGEIIIAKAI